ncbi:4'-phosphopantetheinyl transferase superfamily protein [Spirosoma sp. KCTC 42546]|uniref:4'-phosphopantetheinyl transferase family protein n=1 Tax=Spirosoma sp. KCTC 42546 TaxID=2520506 RepID=UPI00115B76E3|nr:4'-phosphopantetheinyl transferase superfamily protein [Spirosoma sp. KCTC 42546]QDK79704.1 4'-phosphopantetheinyl transferase superfamily protein [Spirosoma sp. KCTC 42546]
MSNAFITNTVLTGFLWHPWSACSFDDKVAVFRFQLSDDLLFDDQLPELQPHEMSRAQRYHRQEDRIRYSYTRLILRMLVGRYLKQEPASIHFTTGINKKPEIKGNTSLHINVSHSGNWILVAIGKASVGVDIEKINLGMTFQDMLSASFSQEEQQYVNASVDPRFAFYELWTRKEALVKATAKGLDDDFPRMPSLNGIHPIDSKLIGAAGDWTVASFAVSEAYPAAVAYRPMANYPTFYTLDSSLFN